MRIGLLSDTHLPGRIRHLDELGPEPARFFSTVDLILHAGDLMSPSVLDWLEQFAPVVCATGNNDPIPDPRSKEIQTLQIEGWSIGMIHILGPNSQSVSDIQQMFPQPVDIVISGHTHYEHLEYREGIVFLNSGSITLPHHKEVRLGTVGILELQPNLLHAEIVVLGHTTGMVNPGQAMVLDVQNGQLIPQTDKN